MYQQYQDYGLMVLSPGWQESQSECQTWIGWYSLTFEVLSDMNTTTSRLFIPSQGGYYYFPHNSIVDQHQILRYNATGFNHSTIENMILSLVEPEVGFDPPTVDFGTVNYGETINLDVVVDNVGTGLLQITNIYTSNPTLFSVTPTQGQIYAVDDSIVVTVTLQANADCVVDETLSVESNAGTQTADMRALVSSTDACLWVEPTAVDFGEVEVDSSGVETLWAYNFGLNAANVTSISISHPDFSVAPTTANIPGGDSVEVTLTYTPSAMDTLSGLTLDILSNGGDRYIEVSALGIQAIINSSMTSVDFGTVEVGGFESEYFRVRNMGNTMLTITNVDLVVNIENMSYNLQEDVLEPGDSTACYLTWVPNSAGTLDGSITFESNGGELVVDLDGEAEQLGVADEEISMPTSFSLEQNYPNPFNASTMIPYAVPQAADISIAIYNIYGRQIQSFNLGEITPGWHQAYWNGKDAYGNPVSTGIYFYRLLVDGRSLDLRKMVYLK